MKFCPGTPDSAKRILQSPEWREAKELQRCIAKLARDERMEEIWTAVREWEKAEIVYFAHSAIHFADRTMLGELTLPPERRVLLSGPHYDLEFGAKNFADAIERNREVANACWLWTDSLEDMLSKLRTFAQRQFDAGYAQWDSLAGIRAPNHRGRGNRTEIAYGNAMVNVLENIRRIHQDRRYKAPLSRSKQDEIVADLTGVIFGHSVDVERIRARRRRSRRKTQAS